MSDGIAYQNKDTLSKILADTFREKSFQAYGVQLPKIKEVLPTNLPQISINEKRADHLFLLEDGTYLLVDYESTDDLEDRIKYINYIGRIMERYYKEKGIIPIRLLIIYTSDVKETEEVLEIPCMTLRMEQVFLSKIEGERIYQSLLKKVKSSLALTEEEQMLFIMLPLTATGKKKKQERVKQMAELAVQIQDEQMQVFLLAGILIASDKFIERSYAQYLKEVLSMTKVAQLYEEEKQDAVKQAKLETTLKVKYDIALKLIQSGQELKDVMAFTGLTKKQLTELQKECR